MLGQMQEQETIPLLLSLLDQPDRLGSEASLKYSELARRRKKMDSEQTLLRLLAREAAEVRAAAARALGQVGTVRAVEPLLALTEGLLASPSVKQAAREAVASIQSRLGDAEAGRLSLAAPAEREGALSLSGDEPPGGELSLPERESTPSESDPST